MRPRREITRMTTAGIVRCCAGCASWLPQTTTHYYQVNKASKSHKAGEWSTLCRACEKVRRAEAYRRGAAGAAKEQRVRDPDTPPRRPYDGHRKSWDFANEAAQDLARALGGWR